MTEIDPKDFKTWPHELERAIGEVHTQECHNNACDHRPTYQAALDDITSTMVRFYLNWQKLLATLTPEEIQRCQRYWNATRRDKCWGLITDLKQTRLQFGWVLCPRWATVLDEVRKMRELLA